MNATAGIHLSDDHLIDLECGLLESSARDAAVQHLRQCPACERRFMEVHAGAQRLSPRRRPTPAEKATPALHLAVPPGPSGRWRARLLVTASGIILVGLIATYELSRRPRADGLDYWLPLDSERLLLRSAPAPEEAGRYLQAVEAYDRHDVRQVIRLLGTGPIPQAYEPLNLVLASALIWDGRYDEARNVLERLDVDTLPQPARDRARWMLFIALRRAGRTEEAASVVQVLAASPGEFSERARALLR